jgi:hypothetical protein
MLISRLKGSNWETHNTVTTNITPVTEIPYPLNVDTELEAIPTQWYTIERERKNCTKQKNQSHLLKENVDDCLSTGLPTPNWAWSLWTKQWKQCILERPGQQILETWHIKKWRSSFVQLNLLTTSVHTWQMLIAVELWGGFSRGSWRQRMLIAVLSLVNLKM